MKKLELVYSRHTRDGEASRILEKNIPYYDLTFVMKGSIEYKINKQTVTLSQGDMILLPPSTLRARTESAAGVDYISFNFMSDEQICLPLHEKDCIDGNLLLLVAAYDGISAKTYLDNEEKIEHILSCMLLLLEDRIKTRAYNPLTLKIIRYIHTNFSQKITLDDIGKLTFFSPIYCDSLFKKDCGKSIINYLLDVRISEAKKLLIEDSVPLVSLCELVGFNDYNYFSRLFKKRTGYTPSAYRKLVKNNFTP